MNIALLTFTVFVFMLTSCNSTLRHQQKCAKWGVCQQVKDSTVYIERTSFDSVVVDNSEFWVDMLFECDSSGSVLVRHIDSLTAKNIDLTTQLKTNRLVIHGNVETQVIRIPILMKSLEKKIVQERITNMLTSMQSFWLVMGKVFAGSILITMISGLLWLRFKKG